MNIQLILDSKKRKVYIRELKAAGFKVKRIHLKYYNEAGDFPNGDLIEYEILESSIDAFKLAVKKADFHFKNRN